MDVSIFPAWVDYYVQLDSGAKSYFGLILMFHLHNNPVMRVSCWILEDDARERKALLLKYLPSEFNGVPPAAQKDEQPTAKQLSLMDRHVYRTMLDTWRTDYNDGKVALCSPAYRKASNMWNKVWMMHKNVTLVQYSASGDMTASAAVVAKVRLVHVPCTHPAHAYMPCPPRHDLLVTRLTHPPTHSLTHPPTHSPCEVPLLGFAGALLAWRVLALCWALHRRGRAAARTRVHARDPLAAPTQLTQLLAEEPAEGEAEGARAHPLARGSRIG